MTAGPSKNTRQWVYRRDGHVCQARAIDPSPCTDLTLHHLLPRHQGGSNRRGNLLTVCERHHRMLHHPRHYQRALELGLLRGHEHRPPPMPKMNEALAVKLGLPWGVPDARAARKALLDAGHVRIDPLPRVAPAAQWPPPPDRIVPPPRCRRTNRPPEPEPFEWTDPTTGHAYLLTPRGARPRPAVHSSDDDHTLEEAS